MICWGQKEDCECEQEDALLWYIAGALWQSRLLCLDHLPDCLEDEHISLPEERGGSTRYCGDGEDEACVSYHGQYDVLDDHLACWRRALYEDRDDIACDRSCGCAYDRETWWWRGKAGECGEVDVLVDCEGCESQCSQG